MGQYKGGIRDTPLLPLGTEGFKRPMTKKGYKATHGDRPQKQGQGGEEGQDFPGSQGESGDTEQGGTRSNGRHEGIGHTRETWKGYEQSSTREAGKGSSSETHSG